MIQGITKLINTRLTAQTNLLIKDFHDSSLQHIVPNQLIVQNLTDGQIWHQLNQHLEKGIQKWNKYLNSIEPIIQNEMQVESEQEKMPQEKVKYDENQQDGEQYQNEEKKMQEEDVEDEEYNENDKMLEMDDEDVGLYGELLDDDNVEKYDNEEDEEEDHEFEQIKKRLTTHKKEEDIEDEVENQNFEHFRQLQVENNQQNGEGQQSTDEITRLENRMFNRQDWRLKGEVGSKQRPLNSLVENPLEFKRGLKFQQQGSPTENSALEDTIKRRILDDMFDDRARLEVAPGFKEHFTSLPQVSVEKSKHSLGELYEIDFANSLGVKSNKQDKEKKQILALFKEINYKLDRLSNFSFIPKPVLQSKINSEPYILRQQNIPITATSNQTIANRLSNIDLKSKKEQGSKRLKTKRIKRQRRKEQEAKRMKRVIEYGGMSKVEAEARKKIDKSKKGNTTKYSQSGQFFKKFQENISTKSKSKPNPNINKLKL